MKLEIFCVTIVTTLTMLCATTSSTAETNDIKLGHLTHHTGDYAGFGTFFDGVTDFTLDMINQDPPLGRRVTAIHQDTGTIGEWRAIKRLLDREKVDIVLNVSHAYESYRTKLLKRISYLKKPILPSVHGGSVDAKYGGNALEPLFRGSPMDTAQSAAAMLHIKESGKQSVVLVSNDLEGHLMQMQAAEIFAERLGLTVITSMVIQPDWTNYSSVVKKIAATETDAVVIFSPPGNGGIFVRNAAEMGHSWFIIGTSEWQEKDFIEQATLSAVRKHESVTLSAHAHDDGPAWNYYKNAAEASEQIGVIGDVANSYAMQYYDLLVTTALAIEKANSTDAEKWSNAMFEVTGGSGQIVHSYAQGIAALRTGKDINYDGVTGSMEFTSTGVVTGLFGIFEWIDMNNIKRVSLSEGDKVAELDQY